MSVTTYSGSLLEGTSGEFVELGDYEDLYSDYVRVFAEYERLAEAIRVLAQSV